MIEPIRLGTRASLLARTQSATVGDALALSSGREWREVLIRTHGDDTTTSLHQPGRPGLFVSALREALLAGEVDVIVHSFKDLPSAPAPGIVIAAVPAREDPRDALVSRDGLTLAGLPLGAVVGTSSPRRAAALARSRPDLRVLPIRGNVDTRIRKVREGEFDATVLAVAGLSRIGRLDEVAEYLEADAMLPAPAQGALAVECRASDVDLIAALALLDDPVARLATAAEREVLVGINAACTTAVSASAAYGAGRLRLRADLTSDDGGVLTTADVSAEVAPDDVLGARVLGMRAAAALAGAGPRGPVLLVRSDGNESDAEGLALLGLGCISDPYVQITPALGGPDAERLLGLVAAADDSTWLVATSPMTVPSWVACVGEERLREAVADAVASGARGAATGARTAAALRELGFPDVLVPESASAADLVASMAGVEPGVVVFPRGDLALRTLPDGLAARGWRVDEGVVYATATVAHVPASSPLVRDGEIAAVLLRSPSAVRALLSFVTPPPTVPIVCAGATTAAAAREAGLAVAAVASSPSSADAALAVAEVLARPHRH